MKKLVVFFLCILGLLYLKMNLINLHNVKTGEAVFIHFPDGLDATGVDLAPITIPPERATLLNTGTRLKVELDANPLKGPDSNKKTLHVWGIPADELSNECIVLRLDFAPGALK